MQVLNRHNISSAIQFDQLAENLPGAIKGGLWWADLNLKSADLFGRSSLFQQQRNISIMVMLDSKLALLQEISEAAKKLETILVTQFDKKLEVWTFNTIQSL